jgi:MFS family permease
MALPPQDPESSHRTPRLLSVLAATLIALSSGTNYAYSAWAPQFASKLNLSATQSNLIGGFGNIGMYAMGIPGGLLIDSRGPRWGVFSGLVALGIGYFSLRGAYVAGRGGVSVPALCFFGMLTGLGSCTAFSAAIKVSATNWPRHRGTATAFPLSAFGLSAFFYTAVSGVAFGDDTAGYLLLLACGTTVMIFVGGVFLQIVRPEKTAGVGYQPVGNGEAREESQRLRRTSAEGREIGRERGRRKSSLGEDGNV